MTYEQCLSKLTALCARGEHCLFEMQVKMDKWEVEEATQRRVLDFLVKERYIDEARYARYFINDKLKYNRWGRRKVEQALYQKRIPSEIYAPIIAEIAEEDFEEVLLPLLQSKRRTVKGGNDYEIRMKLIRFAMQRGFSYDQASRCISKMEKADK